MKNIIIIIAAILALALLLSVAQIKFDNAKGEFTTELPSSQRDEEISTESESSETINQKSNYDFTVVDMYGNNVKRSDFTDKPLVVLFWASWYTYSRQELAALQEKYAQFKDSFDFMAVCITDGQYETVESAKEYLSDNNFDFPIYFDVNSEALNNFQLFEFESVTRTYFFYRSAADGKYKSGKITAGVVLRSDLLEDALIQVLERTGTN